MEAKYRNLHLLLAAAALAVGSFAHGRVHAGEVYRWVDENGEVHYSESLPPHLKGQTHDVLNEEGIVVDENMSLTPEQAMEQAVEEAAEDAASEEREKELEAARRAAKLQDDMDTLLLLRYRSEQEIVDEMNVDIEQLAYDRRLLEGSRSSIEEAYRGQIRQAAQQQRAGEAVDEETRRQVGEMRVRLVENSRSLAALERRESQTRAQFQLRIDRYRQLVEQRSREDSGP